MGASPEFTTVTEKMLSAMRKDESYGISAPQIGYSLQVIAFEVTGHHIKNCMKAYGSKGVASMQMHICPLNVLVNPTIEITNPQVVSFREKCCSMPGYSALVPRCKEVKVRGLSTEGKVVEFVAAGWT